MVHLYTENRRLNILTNRITICEAQITLHLEETFQINGYSTAEIKTSSTSTNKNRKHQSRKKTVFGIIRHSHT